MTTALPTTGEKGCHKDALRPPFPPGVTGQDLQPHALYTAGFLACYLGSFSELSSIVVPTHPQDILGAIVELGEAVEFTVLEVDWGLVDSIEGSLCFIGFVHERLEGLSTQVKVACPPKVQGLPILLDLIFNVQRQARVQEWSIGSQTSLFTQEPVAQRTIYPETSATLCFGQVAASQLGPRT